MPAPDVLTTRIDKLTLVTPWPETLPGVGPCAARLARRIEMASAGSIRISIRQDDHAGIDALAAGSADLYFASEHDNLHHHDAFAHFAGLPFFSGLEPADLEAWLSAAGGQALWDVLAAEHGVKALLAGHLGRAPGLWTSRPIGAVGDLVQGPAAVFGLAARVVQTLGGRPVSIRPVDLKGALETGRVTAVEWAGLATAERMGLAAAANAHLAFGINTAGIAVSLGVRRGLWDAMTPSDRTLIETCAAEAYCNALAEARVGDVEARRRLAAQGLRLESMPGSLMTAIAGAADSVTADLARGSVVARKIHTSYVAFRDRLASVPRPAPHQSARPIA